MIKESQEGSHRFTGSGDFEKLSSFKSAILEFFVQEKLFFASSPWKSVKATWVSRMGRNFDDYPGLQQKMYENVRK